MMQHKLKTLPQYFKEVVSGNKTFEIRKNDRGFKVGDTLILQEHKKSERMSRIANEERGIYTGREITKEITYILEGGQYGLEEGYCILGLKNIEPQKVYVIIYENGLGGNVISVFENKEKAENKVKKLNGIGLRNGTYSVIEKVLIESEE